ncbi:DUF4912 domain-containing protein [Myxococcus qinghaiensis]|uniref:DUF4912 domain-containing protein n=1 Tax=Myxococcus qinghaiensis TaxID=2906758 RepID=UPI0020A80CF5|nr:DUF4912 domain-containing protein [Myxococcus qinghaiensis]MCP3161664.1 DUF4912 domain-containing protein [Myxococcus qinghaiensis]
MDDLKSVTVGSLRELARKHLGSGYSKLNKEELIAALAGFVPSLARLARLVGIELPRKSPAAKRSASGPAKAVTPSARSKQETRSAPKATPSVKVPTGTSKKAKAEPSVKGKAAAAKAKGAAKSGTTPAQAKAQAAVKVPATSSKEKVAAVASKRKAPSKPPAKVAEVASAEKAPDTSPAKVAAVTSKEKASGTTSAKVAAMASRILGKLPAKVAAAAAKALGKLPGKFEAPPVAPLVDARTPSDPLATDTPRAKTPRKAATEMSEQGRVSAPNRVAAKRASEKSDSPPSARPAHIVNFPPKPRGSRDTVTSTEPEAVSGASHDAARPSSPSSSSTEAPPSVEPIEQHPAEPLIEGFFVARVRGEAEARRHHLQQPPEPTPEPPPFAAAEPEAQEPLPREYHDDTALLLPRDPHTLFALWDFSPATRSRAMKGLEEPRAVLRVFDGDSLVREMDCALESRGYYIHGLPAGRPYRVEAHFVGRDGKAHRIGPSSNRVALPPTGVSTDTSVRFLRRPVPVEPEAPAAVPVPTLAPENHEREYITWHRVNLPGSAGVKDIPVVHREGVGPGVPPSPEGPGSQVDSGTYLQGVERAPGASDQRYVASHRYLDAQGRAPGASDMRYGEGPVLPVSSPRAFEYLELGQVRAPGSSEQRYQEGATQTSGKDARPPYQYLDIARAPGASDMRYAEPPPRSAGPTDAAGLAAPPRPTGSPELHYFEAPARAPGASDQRYFESPPRAPGASDRRYSDLAGGLIPEPVKQVTGSSDQDSYRKPPSGGGRS